MIGIKINVNLIDKKRLFEGKKGKYLDAVLIPTPDSKYDQDYMVVESVTKAERDAGKQGTILGSGKIIATRSTPKAEASDSDNLPF